MILPRANPALIVLDFDHTLFNTTKLVSILTQEFVDRFKVSKDVFLEKRDEVKSCCVVEDVDLFLSKLPYSDKKEMHDVYHQIVRENARSLVFDDVEEFLDAHKERFDIGILTHGDTELQTEKIVHAGLGDLPREIILRGKAEPVSSYLEAYETVHYVDDRAENIDMIKTTAPQVVTYFMRRPEDSPYGDHAHSACEGADYEVESLRFTLPLDS